MKSVSAVCVSVQRKKQLGGERIYCLVSDSDIIRQSFVRGIKWNGKKKRRKKKTWGRQDTLWLQCLPLHVPVSLSAPVLQWSGHKTLFCSIMARLVSILCLLISELQFVWDKVRWLHVYLPWQHEWYSHVEIKSDPGCCDCSLLIKSAALFLRRAHC